ncbi:MAG: small multi-drug export protein [Planctomycetes bacterium]|nr:small multi-drug export protein [Planctomycetota bacterium]
MASDQQHIEASGDGGEAPGGPEPRGSLVALLLPLVVSILLLTLIFFFLGGDVALEVGAVSLATVTVAGKFIVLRGLADSGFFDSPYKLVPLIVYLDIFVATIAVYNMGLLYRIPRFGDKLRALQRAGVQILSRNPWMRKVTFFGIVAFVMFPLSGTGAIGGAFFGRLLGLSRLRTMVGIAIGAVCGGFAMAALASGFGEALNNIQGNPVFVVGGVLVVGGIGYWLWRRASQLGDR